MKAGNGANLVISVRQPWAWLILHGGKDVENRTWPTKVRGRVLIHASSWMSRMEYESARLFVVSEIPNEIEIPTFEAIECGGIVGSVTIADCVNQSQSPWFEGPWGFVLKDPLPMAFIPCRGSLGFWRWPPAAAPTEGGGREGGFQMRRDATDSSWTWRDEPPNATGSATTGGKP